MLLCQGQGREPRLEFEPNLQEFGPVLAHSSGDEQEILVKNPCDFPVEFYNLEFDKGYLEEERVRNMSVFYSCSMFTGFWQFLCNLCKRPKISAVKVHLQRQTFDLKFYL